MPVVSDKGGNESTKGLYCHGCQLFEVVTRKRVHGDKVGYWCDRQHRYFLAKKMTEEECPLNTDKLPGSRFNKWRGLWTR